MDLLSKDTLSLYKLYCEAAYSIVVDELYPEFEQKLGELQSNPEEVKSKFAKQLNRIKNIPEVEKEKQLNRLIAISAAEAVANEYAEKHPVDKFSLKAQILDRHTKELTAPLSMVDFERVATTKDRKGFDTSDRKKEAAEAAMRGFILSPWRKYDGEIHKAGGVSFAEWERRMEKIPPMQRPPAPPIFGEYNFEKTRDIFMKAVEESRPQNGDERTDELLDMLHKARQYALPRGMSRDHLNADSLASYQYDTPDDLLNWWEAGKRNYERSNSMITNAQLRGHGYVR